MAATKPPPRNLSPDAVPWARWAENNIQALSDTDERNTQSLNNNLKAINGSLAALGAQIASFNTNYFTTHQQLSFTNFSMTAGSDVTQTLVIPIPDGYRSGVVSINAFVQFQTSMALPADARMNMEYGYTNPSGTGLGSGIGPPIIPSTSSLKAVYAGMSFTIPIGILTNDRYCDATFGIATNLSLAGYSIAANAFNTISIIADGLWFS